MEERCAAIGAQLLRLRERCLDAARIADAL
jgi:hypothetical protein